MANLFKNRYRISSFRLQSWDYSIEGFYFITICTANRAHFFGEIVQQQMQLTELGKIAESEWYRTSELHI